MEADRQLDHGKYRVIRLIGRGGMGSVYEAENLRTHKRVAIKSVNPAFAGNEQLTQRLVREAQAAARISHPNVVDVYDVIAEADALHLVMEYLEGETLTAQLKRGGLSTYALIALLLPALHGVAAAHKRGVIHRDLKPDNIFLARDDSGRVTPKVLDFGISKLQERGADQLSLTGAGNVLGTPHYMSVEQLSGAKDTDARSDVYAIGVILYEALTGRLPFEADTFPELIYKITSTTPPEIKALRSELPTTLARLVGWAMARDRDDRIESIDALIKELEPFSTAHGWNSELTHPGTAAPQPIPVRNRTSRPPPAAGSGQSRENAASSGKRRLALAALALTTLAGAGALGAWKALQPPALEADHTETQAATAASVPQPAAAAPIDPSQQDPGGEIPLGAVASPEPQQPTLTPEPSAAPPDPTSAPPTLGAARDKPDQADKQPLLQAPKRRHPPSPIQALAPAEPPSTTATTAEQPTTPAPQHNDPRTFRVLARPRSTDF